MPREITTAMVDAGIEAVRRFDREVDTDEDLVRSVFIAMSAAAVLPAPAPDWRSICRTGEELG